jgi:cyclophilin family peptidyl-prolyl cis-trans isomerase
MNRILPVLLIVALLVVGGIWLSRPNRPQPVNATTSTTTTSADTTAAGTVQAQTDTGSGETGTGAGDTSGETTPEPASEPGSTEPGGTDSTTPDTTTSDTPNTDTTTDEPTGAQTATPSKDAATTDATATEAAATTTQPPTPPEGFTLTPFLSDKQTREFSQAEQVLEEGKDYQAIIVTNKGSIRVDLFEDQAPKTVNNFVFLTLNHFYDGVVFHRVLQDFMAQTGDPTGTGTGGPGYQFEDEFVDALKFDKRGVLAMANSGPATNGSQFFITFAPTDWLNGLHSIFGEVVEGDDALGSIKLIEPGQAGAPPIIGMMTDTLETLAGKGIALKGEPTATLESYLTTTLGTLPDMGAEFEIDGFKAQSGRMGEAPAVGFFTEDASASTPDVMQAVYIIEKAKN